MKGKKGKGRRKKEDGRIFLLSPANAGGPRGKMVLSERAQFDLATRYTVAQTP